MLAALAGLAMCIAGAWNLERARSGLTIAPLNAGATPATVYRRDNGASAPVVVICHGFAGSRQFMEAYALTLAHAGYIAVAFDFEGHGRNPRPMSGDVTHVDGTTRLLQAEIGRVTDAALALLGADGRVALLGHSMASDIIVRQAIADPRVGATVAISMFSNAVTALEPRDLLIVSGAWETMLRANALHNVRLIDPAAKEDETIGDPAKGSGRRAAVAPGVEHIGVLYSSAALLEARKWLDAAFGRESTGPVATTGMWIILLLSGIVLLAWPMSSLLPRSGTPVPAIAPGTFLLAALAPAALTPLLLRFVDTRFLPVLVAGYLTAHLLVYGGLCLGILALRGVRPGRIAIIPALALATYGILVFGGALDRYVASFMPIPARLPIIAAMAVGAIPYMLGESVALEGGRAPFWRMLVARGAFLVSLGIAVTLDFQRLFFLLIILPVIVAFFVVFGLMGGWVGRRTMSPAAVGLALGLILAWSLGVTFPMFSRG